MSTFNRYTVGLLATLMAVAIVGCRSGSGQGGGNGDSLDTTRPAITSTSTAGHAEGVAIDRTVTATFSEPMNAATINSSTFSLTEGASTRVPGTVTCTDTVATFTPWANLTTGAVFTARIAKQVTDLAGNMMAAEAVWTFETGEAAAKGPARVTLGNAGGFVILAKSNVSTTGITSVVGDIGLSPSDGSLFTGFSNTMDTSGRFSTSSSVTGKMYAADYSTPAPQDVALAISDMQAACSDAAGRNQPDSSNIDGGSIDRTTLSPGLHKWAGDLSIANGITFSGGPNDIWIIQVGKNLALGNGGVVSLRGGAQAMNIFWQVDGNVELGTTSDFSGIILCKKQIVIRKGAVMTGRALAQTTVTLDAASITAP